MEDHERTVKLRTMKFVLVILKHVDIQVYCSKLPTPPHIVKKPKSNADHIRDSGRFNLIQNILHHDPPQLPVAGCPLSRKAEDGDLSSNDFAKMGADHRLGGPQHGGVDTVMMAMTMMTMMMMMMMMMTMMMLMMMIPGDGEEP